MAAAVAASAVSLSVLARERSEIQVASSSRSTSKHPRSLNRSLSAVPLPLSLLSERRHYQASPLSTHNFRWSPPSACCSHVRSSQSLFSPSPTSSCSSLSSSFIPASYSALSSLHSSTSFWSSSPAYRKTFLGASVVITKLGQLNYGAPAAVAATMNMANMPLPDSFAATSRSERLRAFDATSADAVAISILGDLHLDAKQMGLFHGARSQLCTLLDKEFPDSAKRVVQLGDLGSSKFEPGTAACFQKAVGFLSGFGVPFAAITGNHDLEGSLYETDEENLQVWKDEFGMPHHWAAEAAGTLIIGLSTTRYRSNDFSVHEVYVDDQQIAWLEESLDAHKEKPVIIFTHAPPLGCGLHVLHEVHVRNRCAYLNHSSHPEYFLDLVKRKRGQIKMWFNGHYHLSHNYADSITVNEGCAFIQTGVIGLCNKDGNRQSRVLRLTRQGANVYTCDHDYEEGGLRLDLEVKWDQKGPPEPIIPVDELLCDPSLGYLCGISMCSMIGEERGNSYKWFPAGDSSILALQEDILVDYDPRYQAPVGVVCQHVNGRDVRLVDSKGHVLGDTEDGREAVAVELVSSDGTIERIARNTAGSFWQNFQPNKWRLKKMQEQIDMGLEATIPVAAAV